MPSTISYYLGVTEPAMFGVNLKYSFPFICAMIGSSLAAIISVATKTAATAIGVGGIPGILSIQPQHIPSFAIAMIVAIAVPFALTFFVGLKKLSAEDRGLGTADIKGTESKKEAVVSSMTKEDIKPEFRAFSDGKVITLKELNDGVFSEGVVGEGLAVIPEGDMVYAPCEATVSLVMADTKHAVGLKLDNGVELILHVGIDTVNMKGEGFEYFVEKGQRIRPGEKLIKFDKEKIKEAGHKDEVVCVITSPNAKNIKFHTGLLAKANDTVIIEFN